ncbi:DUF1579 family protein [Undibacterium terreum]|uniref:DUF1579 domain-containing protein n=1 Tax=Undibacterium terreum TaxID=1224302 RepID=A0A916UYI6_9BURK|nr:DUF1579 family protein [Undibacterium terreum]GGC94754.1 hypothetical protein GCM10011396_47640 [Undibacterium terreum]
MAGIFSNFVGQWEGRNRLFLSWPTPSEFLSDTRLTVTELADGSLLQLNYDWSHEGKPQQGILLLAYDAEKNSATASWGDSWHASKKLLPSSGAIGDDGLVNLLGSFEAPPDPDWGWRILLKPVSGSEMQIAMYVIPPGEEEQEAVTANYRRLPG